MGSIVTILFLFVIHSCFFYERELHPTVATFIRVTLGFGIVLVAFFVPILVIGSDRYRGLVEDETARQQAVHQRA